MLGWFKKSTLLVLISFCCASISNAGPIVLEKKTVLDGKIQILLPKHFKIMSKKMMKIKYPSEYRPPLVYTDETAGITVNLNYTSNLLSPEYIQEHLLKLVTTFKNLFPSATWYGKKIIKVNNRKFGMLELLTPALDTEIYNIIFFTSLNNRVLLISFNCTKKQMNEWVPIGRQILQSIIVLKT